MPDFEHLELFVCLGSNPLVSQMSVLQVSDAAGVLSSIIDRGGRVVIVARRARRARVHTNGNAIPCGSQDGRSIERYQLEPGLVPPAG